MKFPALVFAIALALSTLLFAQTVPTSSAPEVPYPDGYRRWMHITSVVSPPKKAAMGAPADEAKASPPHGLIHHLYANEKALEGYRTGHFPEGAVLIADWFALEEARSGLVQGPRESLDVMIRDARYATTGGWGFEKFDQDSHTNRKVSTNAFTSCFKCHQHAGVEREFVFSTLKE